MTRGGVDALKEQLWAEAMRHSLGRAAQVLIVADGAAWIWNLAGDRFPGARQRVGFYHVSQHLWSVAHALHSDDAGADRVWVEPMQEKLKADESCEVITELEQLRERLEGRRGRAWNEQRPIWKPIEIGWTAGRPESKTNPWAVGRWNRPAGHTKCGSNARVSFGASRGMKRCCVWKPSGATEAGPLSSLTPALLRTPVEIDLRPIIDRRLPFLAHGGSTGKKRGG